MNMIIEEAYVSFEVAKLLKEKGFNEPCRSYYTDYEDYIDFSYCNDELTDLQMGVWETLRPTHQMAMKWLREVHNIFIEISVDEMLKDEGYQWALYYNSTKEIRPYSGWGNSYEEAVEAALKYSLENLI